MYENLLNEVEQKKPSNRNSILEHQVVASQMAPKASARYMGGRRENSQRSRRFLYSHGQQLEGGMSQQQCTDSSSSYQEAI
ncbi:hypothetical protein O9929_14810 [Vibrio lentus]|nr:hypothetical protein [Vibrio lentus]